MSRFFLTQKRIVPTLFFLAALVSYLWANQFPYFYHSDEESKALQILYGYRNYWHPMLMLNATRLFAQILGMDQDAQSITMVGRTLSAVFSAVGVACFVNFAWSCRGSFTACLTGGLLLITPLLFEVSHYCKEDPALFMGLGLTLVALQCFLTLPDQRALVFLGISTGIATSAKYPGVILLIAMVPVIFWRWRRPFPFVPFVIAFACTVLAINCQWLLHASEVITGIQRESSLLAAGHDGVSAQFPSAAYFNLLRYETGGPILFAALLGILLPFRKKETFSTEFTLGISALVLLGAMSFSGKVSDRYLLPIIAIGLYLSACGIHLLTRFFSGKTRFIIALLFIGFVAWHPLQMMRNWIADFQRDSRAEMARWITTHSAPNDQVATSLWTRLPGIYPGQYISGVAPADYVADLGTVAQLREMRYRWVAVAEVERQRFSGPLQQGSAISQAAFLRRRLFYEDLEREGTLRWSSPTSYVYHLHPGLKLYELQPQNRP